MDKKRTGELIKNARMSKNYTQTELGDLVGVSNKAVSRWENGESFPDVGVLETLSNCLDLKIEDIVQGKLAEEPKSEALSEIVRAAKIQERQRSREYREKGTDMGLILYLTFLCGNGAFGNHFLLLNRSHLLYMGSLILLFAIFLFRSANRTCNGWGEGGRMVKLVGFLPVILSAYIGTLYMLSMILASQGRILFGIALEKLGPFLNNQLMLICFVCLGITIFLLYREYKYEEQTGVRLFVAVAAIHLCLLYSNLLYQLESFDFVCRIFATYTGYVVGVTVLTILGLNVYRHVHSAKSISF